MCALLPGDVRARAYIGVQLDAVGGGVLLDAGDPLGAGNSGPCRRLATAARPERSVPVLRPRSRASEGMPIRRLCAPVRCSESAHRES